MNITGAKIEEGGGDNPETAAVLDGRWIFCLLAVFLVLGGAIRLNRYLLRFPLWGDEAGLAVNFIDRGYAELLQPLEYSQVAPVGFLWLVKAVISQLGFTEYSLRIIPALCALLSLYVFYRAAKLMLSGLPLLFSTAILAVAYYPIRHGAEIKQYSTDLLVAVVILWLALGYLTRPKPAAWLGGLCLFLPLALAVSYPAVFVAGGIALPLLYRAGKTRAGADWRNLAVYLIVLLGSFAVIYFTLIRIQLNYELEILAGRHMFTIWEDTFPPLDRPLRFVFWMIRAHTGRMFAYPVGGKHGGSIVTFVCFLTGAAVLWRRKDRRLFFLFIGPFIPAFLAAALRRYPYGYSARWMLYLAPFISIPAGLGAADLISRIRRIRWRKVVTLGVITGLGLIGLGSIARDLSRPYKAKADFDSRTFARSFWRDNPEDGGLFCLKEDLGQDIFSGLFLASHNSARYLCNRAIYYSRRPRLSPAEFKRQWSGGDRFNLVVYSVPGHDKEEERFLDLLGTIQERAELTGYRSYNVNEEYPAHREKYEVYEFNGK